MFINRPFRFFDGLADRIASVLGAVALSQFPQYYGQYMQRLGGHLDEARFMLQQYIDAAAALGLNLDVYIREHLESGSEVFTSTGRIIAALVERVQTLEQAYQALQGAGLFSRWFVFLREVDWNIAAGTWENFVPGVPTTLEGLVYALTGLLVGWGLYALLKSLIAIPIKAVGQKNKTG